MIVGGPAEYKLEQSIEAENQSLKAAIAELKAELTKYRMPPLLVAEVVSTHEKGKALIRLLNGNSFYVHIDRSLGSRIRAGDEVLLEQKSLTVVRRIGTVKPFNAERFVIMEKPTVGWGSVGGLREQTRELKEVIELPLRKPEVFEKVGIDPPKGVLLYGHPGTGKTLLAKAVAKSTNATFIEIVGSELVQKFIGQGAKLVKSIFQLAREKAPAIIFIDELDSIAARRVEIGTSGEREVQRTFMQLLAEIDGFKPLGDVKIIGATNRLDIIDPAVIRPGRLDRMIRIPLADRKGREEIFRIHTRRMTLGKDVSLEELASTAKKMSGAEIRAVCIEAGYFAIRRGAVKMSRKDFERAVKKVRRKEKEDANYLSYIS